MCCLFGLLDPNQSLTGVEKSKLLHVLALKAEARGTDAAGIAYHADSRLMIHKAPVPGRKLTIQIPDDAIAVMGHTRMTTQGNEQFNRNNHPFRGNTSAGPFALAHNGVLWNDRELRKSLNLPATKIETDSYIAVQLIEQKRTLDFSSLRYMAELVEGSFTFTVLDAEDSLYIVKGDSPFCLYQFPKLGLYIYASTGEILQDALNAARLPVQRATKISVDSGEIVKLSRTGKITRTAFDDTKLYQGAWMRPRCCAPCSYLDELKDTAAWMGYPPELIEHFTGRGYTPEEIEEFLYAGEI